MEALSLTVCEKDDLPINGYIVKKLIGRQIAVIRIDKDSFMAIDCLCKHQAVNLLETTTGILSSFEVTCPRHGWCYDLLTGSCLSHDSVQLRTYPTTTDGKKVKVTLALNEE